MLMHKKLNSTTTIVAKVWPDSSYQSPEPTPRASTQAIPAYSDDDDDHDDDRDDDVSVDEVVSESVSASASVYDF